MKANSSQVVISSGQTASAALPVGDLIPVGLRLPAALTGTTMSFQVSDDGTTYVALNNELGTAYTVVVAASKAVPLNAALFQGFGYIKCVSGSAEGADRTIVVELHPDPKALTNGGALTQAVTADTELPAAATLADGTSTPTTPLVGAALEQYNGTNWEFVRGNIDGTGIASAARTATTNSGDLTNHNRIGIHVVLDATAQSGGSVTLTIQGKSALSGQYYTILAGAAVTTVSTNVYKVYPGLTASANAVASDVIPRTFRLLFTHNNGSSITYSVSYSLIGS